MGLTKEEWKHAMLRELKQLKENLESEREFKSGASPAGYDPQAQRELNEQLGRLDERIDATEAQAEKLLKEIRLYEQNLARIEKDADYQKVKDVEAVKSLRESAESLAKEKRFEEASKELAKLPEAIKQANLAAVRAENEQKKAEEKRLFEETLARVGFKVEEFNTYEDVAKLAEPVQLGALQKAFDDMLERARKMAAAGASREEQQEMFEHIPKNFWPNRMFEQYDAWRETEARFLEEAVANLNKPKEEGDGTAKSISEKAESVGSVFELGGKAKTEDKEAFMAETRNLAAEITENLGALTGVVGGAAGIVGGEGAKEKVKGAEKIAEALVTIFDTVADKLESVEQLKAIKSIVDAVTKVSKGLLDTGMAVSDAQDATDSAEAAKTADKRLASQKKAEEELWNAISTATNLGVSFTEVILPVAGVAVTEINPVLGVPSNALAVMKDVKEIAEKKMLRDDTKGIQAEAAQLDPRYLPMLKQELANIDKQIAKKSVDAVGNAAQGVGGIVAVAGPHGTAVGTGIAITGKVITYGGKFVFYVVDQKKASDCKKLVQRARANDRQAMEEIFENSGRYAKMFLAIGVTEDPPHPIAKKFVLSRGMTEEDLKDPATSTYVVRQFLLTASEEKDDHKTVLDTIGEGLESFQQAASDFANSVDRTIPYDDNAQKWTPGRPVYSGRWWLATETEAKKNGLRVDPALDAMQGRMSRYEDACRIYNTVSSEVNHADLYEAAEDLLVAVRDLNPLANDGNPHKAMAELKKTMVDELTPIVERLRKEVHPDVVAEGLRLMAEACNSRREKIDELIGGMNLANDHPILLDYENGKRFQADDNPVEANEVYNRVILNLMMEVAEKPVKVDTKG